MIKILITSDGGYLASLQEDAKNISGGTVSINDKTYSVTQAEVDEIPAEANDFEYVYDNGRLVPNPDYIDGSIETRLNDIEQILIDLLDTI